MLLFSGDGAHTKWHLQSNFSAHLFGAQTQRCGHMTQAPDCTEHVQGRCGSSQSITITITDSCPECEANHLDIQALTFNKVRHRSCPQLSKRSGQNGNLLVVSHHQRIYFCLCLVIAWSKKPVPRRHISSTSWLAVCRLLPWQSAESTSNTGAWTAHHPTLCPLPLTTMWELAAGYAWSLR